MPQTAKHRPPHQVTPAEVAAYQKRVRELAEQRKALKTK